MFVLSALTFVFGMFGVGASGVVATVSAGDAETAAPSIGGEVGCFSSREPGNLHFPSLFCGQTTFGASSDTSLITSRFEKRESKRR